MINREELLSQGDIKSKEIALNLMEETIRSADPYEAVKRALKVEDNMLIIKEKEFPIKGKIYVLAFGKAACSMAQAVEEILDDKIAEGIAVTKYGYSLPLKKIKVIEAGHPIPDENSMKGAHLGVELAKKVGENDILLVLISGGGSALFMLPEDGISLEDKMKTNELLLKSGAKIYEINTVRKHISKVKGGKLAKLVKGTLISLVLSDVVGDPLEAIASGPTVKDPTTFQDAYRLLKLYNVWDKLPQSVKRHIELGIEGEREETLKEDLPNVHNFLIASNSLACEAAKRKAEELGLNAYILTTTLEGEAREVAIAFGSIIEEIYHRERPFKRPCVLIAGGETTVTIEGEPGLGGPNQEFALSIARKIAGLKGVAVLAMDTDGTDGPTDAAGGLVDSYTLEVLRKKEGIDVEEFLKRHNAYEALKRAKALLITGPTRTNVNSIVIAVIL
ncbi:glycerate kinase [Thermococcus sp.]|uniref:glycerate kinase type-2 family protein n=1 Tax=Thermococcus sp. TaxID=35749 RepID=UPI00076D3340|nr:glycerate kinase [Thermococcus sp.]KUK29348.1 MAG: Putative glycerate kinase [Thermococcus sp. 40_45]MBC7094652.1 glycerate kinase [Thermococcus sp.]HII67870.1 glycerate kinase [Thermococcaceae archaeon]